MTRRHTSKEVQMISISRRNVPCASLAGAGAAMVGAVPALPATPRISERFMWRRLWEDHITWTRVVIISVLDARPAAETDAYVTRLLQNPQDMADALRPFYGSAADAFWNLFKDHLVQA